MFVAEFDAHFFNLPDLLDLSPNMNNVVLLGSAEPSLPDLLDLPPNMSNFVLLGSAEPSMLFQANLHASWWYPMLLSSQQCSTVPV